MNRKDLLLKLKDYNKEFDEMLEQKDFSEDVKNLLSSILYKIEENYKEYKVCKIIETDKIIFIQNIINTIKDHCRKIELVRKDSVKGKVLVKYNLKAIADIKAKTIISFPNEISLFYGIIDLMPKYFNIDDKDYLEKMVYVTFLKQGYTMNVEEVLRDFTGFSWNMESDSLTDVRYNLIYQMLNMLVKDDFLEKWRENKNLCDSIEKLIKLLEKEYGKEKGAAFLEKLNTCLCLIEYEKNQKLKDTILKEKNKVQKELKVRTKNKITYLDKMSKDKKELNKKLKEIDKLLSSPTELKKQLEIKRKENNSKNSILDIAYITENLSKERKEIIDKMGKITEKMNPINFNENTKVLQNKEKMIDKMLYVIENEKLDNSLEDLENSFLEAIEIKLLSNDLDKKDIINIILQLRYFAKLPTENNKKVLDNIKIKEKMLTFFDKIIDKCKKEKIISTVSEIPKINNEIIKKVFLTNIIDIQNIEIQIKAKQTKLIVGLFNKDEAEESFEIDKIGFADIAGTKIERKFKLFI